MEAASPSYSLCGWLQLFFLQWRRIFLMKYLVTVEEAVGLGTKIVRRMLPSDQAIVNSFSLWMASENLADSLLFSASQ